jgi:hypothetical protein
MTWTPIRSAISATCAGSPFAKGGAPISRLTFGLDAYDLFSANDAVQKLLTGKDVARQSDSTLSALGSENAPYEFMGVLQGANGQGRVEIYTYNEQYEDEAGVTQSIMGSHGRDRNGRLAQRNALLRRDP